MREFWINGKMGAKCMRHLYRGLDNGALRGWALKEVWTRYGMGGWSI
jgi:hypothetical protein